MDNNKTNKIKKDDNKNNDVVFYNDQIGENASEEINSEKYDNILKNKINTRGL